MLQDTRGEPISTDNIRALELYEKALRQFHTYVGDPVATIEEALLEAPDFVLGHVFRATMLLLTSEKQYLPEVKTSLAAAQTLAGRANERERGLVFAAKRWLDGDWSGACQSWDEVLLEHPHDAFALQAAHLTDFLRGDAGNLRDRVARVLPHWSENTPSYSYVLGMYAFGLEECNHYDKAEEVGRRALQLEPRDGWAVHAVTHVMEMQNRYQEGIAWLTTREQDWAPDSGFAFHNWWHLALYHLERDESARALELYDTRILPEPADLSMQLLDASALLWRLYLQGVDTGDRWPALAAIWEGKADAENGYYAFNDLHALMAYVADGREQQAARLLEDVQQAAQGPGINGMMTREVGLPTCRALYAFAHGDYDGAIQQLLPVRAIASRFGGSHAQRDVLNQTLIEAAIRAGRHRLAENLINERLALKPDSPLAWRFRAKADRAAGRREAADQARAHADALIAERAGRVA